MKTTTKWLIIGALLAPTLAFAQLSPTNATGSTSAPWGRPGPYIQDAAKQRVEAWKGTFEERKASTTEAIKAKYDELKNAFTEQREAILQTIAERREELKAIFENKRASTTDLIRQKREAITDELKKRRAEMIEQYFEKVAALFQNRIDRLSQIADHVAERIAKLEDERGVDLSQASAQLQEAHTLLDEASAKTDEFSDTVLEAVDASAAAEAMKALRQEVWQSIQAAHQALVEAIRLVKASLGQGSATTTNAL